MQSHALAVAGGSPLDAPPSRDHDRPPVSTTFRRCRPSLHQAHPVIDAQLSQFRCLCEISREQRQYRQPGDAKPRQQQWLQLPRQQQSAHHFNDTRTTRNTVAGTASHHTITFRVSPSLHLTQCRQAYDSSNTRRRHTATAHTTALKAGMHEDTACWQLK